MPRDLGFFLLGLAFIVPAGLMVNLLTPKVQEGLAHRTKIRSEQRTRRLLKEYEYVKKFSVDREKLHGYLLAAVLRALSVTAVIAILTGLATLPFAVAYFIVGPLIIVAASVLLRICQNAVRLYTNTTDFDAYKKFVSSITGQPLDSL